MATPELITDEIVEKAKEAYSKAYNLSYRAMNYTPDYAFREMLLEIQDDITRPVYNLLRGYKQDAEAYKRALRQISITGDPTLADDALKGDYHKTDFTEFCEQNQTGGGI